MQSTSRSHQTTHSGNSGGCDTYFTSNPRVPIELKNVSFTASNFIGGKIEPNLTMILQSGSVGQTAKQKASSVIARLFKAVTSPQVLAGSGSTVVLIPDNLISCGVMGTFTLISAVNEFRNISGDSHGSKFKSHDSEGVKAFLVEKLNSPGFCVGMQSLTYMATAAKSLSSGDILNLAAFSLFSIGESACFMIANRDYRAPSRTPLKPEILLRKLWNNIPQNLRVVLKNPGAMFPTGNLLLIAAAMHATYSISGLSAFTSNSAILGLTVFGLGTCSAAVVNGFWPLFSSKSRPASGMASVVGGLGDISLGVSTMITSASSGNSAGAYVGLATTMWGISNILFGAKVEPGVLGRLLRLGRQ